MGAEERRELRLGGVALLGALLLFAPRLAREVVLLGDSSELTAAAIEWGVPHPPGYPLWTALAHLAAKLPFGSPALWVHGTSALYHALTVAFVAAATFRLTKSSAAALAAASSLAFAGSFLLGSLYAEVFPLNDLVFSVLLWLALRFRDSGAPSRASGFAGAIVLGLGLAHHHMIVVALPALAMIAYAPLRRALDARRVGAVLGLVLGAFVLSELPTLLAARRDPFVNYGDVHDAASFFRLITRADYGGLLSATHQVALSSAGDRVGSFALIAWQSVGPLSLVFATVGATMLVVRRRRESLALLVAILLTGPVFSSLNSVSVLGEASEAFFERFTSMFLVPFAILVGAAVPALASYVRAQARPYALVALALLPALSELPKALEIDLSKSRMSGAFASDLLASMPPGALVLISGDIQTSAVQYSCAVERACDGRIVIAPGQLFVPWKESQTRRRYPELSLPQGTMRLARSYELVAMEIDRRPVFVAPSLVVRDRELASAYRFVQEGLLLRVVPRSRKKDWGRGEFLELTRQILEGEACRGCQPPKEIARRPTPDARLLAEYAGALRNMSRHAKALGAVAEGHALYRRAWELDRVAKSE